MITQRGREFNRNDPGVRILNPEFETLLLNCISLEAQASLIQNLKIDGSGALCLCQGNAVRIKKEMHLENWRKSTVSMYDFSNDYVFHMCGTNGHRVSAATYFAC